MIKSHNDLFSVNWKPRLFHLKKILPFFATSRYIIYIHTQQHENLRPVEIFLNLNEFLFKVKFKILLPSKLPTYVCILSVLCTYLPNYFTNYLVHRYLLPRLIIDDYMSLLNLFEIPKINSNCALRLNASSYSAQNIIEKMDFDQMSKVNYVRSLGGRGVCENLKFCDKGEEAL